MVKKHWKQLNHTSIASQDISQPSIFFSESYLGTSVWHTLTNREIAQQNCQSNEWVCSHSFLFVLFLMKHRDIANSHKSRTLFLKMKHPTMSQTNMFVDNTYQQKRCVVSLCANLKLPEHTKDIPVARCHYLEPIQAVSFGPMNMRCVHCGALHWLAKCLRDSSKSAP
jgi:hypothetical protein